MFLDGFDAIFSILFPILFLCGGFGMYSIHHHRKYQHMEQKQPFAAADRSGNGGGKAHRSFASTCQCQIVGGTDTTCTFTSYYVTFQVESGDRMEFEVDGSDYGLLVQGDIGKLSFQGTRYLGFERS